MRKDFLEAMSKAACSVYVVTTAGMTDPVGVTVSAVSSVSADSPSPSLLICVHHLSPAAEAIRANGSFCVNLLGEGQSHISEVFAGRAGVTGAGKFAFGDWKTGKTGCPMLSDPVAAFDCRVMHNILCGSHHIFVGEIEQVHVSDESSALIYVNRAYGRAQELMEPA